MPVVWRRRVRAQGRAMVLVSHMRPAWTLSPRDDDDGGASTDDPAIGSPFAPSLDGSLSTLCTCIDTSEARNVFNDAQRDLTSLENSVSSTRSTLDRLASGEYGPQAEWKKLENTCITKEQGDYTYELCWLGRATQKSNRDGASHHLGTFFGWNQDPTVDKSSETYYSKQLYNRG